MKQIPLILYVLVGAVNLLGHGLDIDPMVRFSKPMIVPVLLFLVYFEAKGHVTLTTMLLVGALLFSWLGDLALMQDGDNYFLMGIGAFFVAQLIYCYAFIKSSFEKPEFRLTPLLPILTFTIFLLVFVTPAVPDALQIPIVIYALTITTMACLARLRLGLTSSQSYQWVITGALLFVTSDAAIAVDKFYRPVPYDDLVIMGTYIAAQVFIAKGILAHPE